MERFSRTALLEKIDRHIENLYTRHGFDRKTGTAQLRGTTDTERVLAYGELVALQCLRDDIAEGV